MNWSLRLLWRFHTTMFHLYIGYLFFHLFENFIKVVVYENILK